MCYASVVSLSLIFANLLFAMQSNLRFRKKIFTSLMHNPMTLHSPHTYASKMQSLNFFAWCIYFYTPMVYCSKDAQ